jgi:hypothetical protein
VFALVVAIAGCGRLGFEDGASQATTDARPDRDASDPDGGSTTDAAPATCVSSDNQCLVACVGQDTDCETTCGDGRCVGNSGEEHCGTCPSDCNTQAVVCGNGECEPGETPDCYADCGPSPWQWDAEENVLLMRVNAARTSGFNCPGPPTTVELPLQISTTMRPGTREWAWDLAHNLSTGSASCNGRSMPQRVMAAGGGVVWYAYNPGLTPEAAIDFFLADGSACQSIMNGNWTTIGLGAAKDVINGYVIMMN